MFSRLAALLLLSTLACAETPAGCADRPAPSNTLPTVADDAAGKKGLKQRLKDQFSQGCVSAIGNTCWGSDNKEEKKPQEPPPDSRQPPSDQPDRPILKKRDDPQPPSASTPAPPPSESSSQPRKQGPDLTFPEEQSREAEIKAKGELPTHASANTSSSRATFNPPPSDDVIEMHPYDPHRAEKDVEVGDYYYKQNNYRAAISRYREALDYRPREPRTTFKLADAYEKASQLDDAALAYSEYVREFPDGAQVAQARLALQRLAPRVAAQSDRLKKMQVDNDIKAGEYLIAQKNYPEAVNRFCDVAAAAPDSARAFFRLAQAQQQTGEFASAVANYQVYLKLAPDGPFAPEARREISRLAPQVQQGKASAPSSETRP